MKTTISVLALTVLTGSAVAGPTLLVDPALLNGSLVGDTMAQARFRGTTNNFDLALDNSGSAQNGSKGELSNSASALSQSFSFLFEYNGGTDPSITFTVTSVNNPALTQTVSITDTISAFNTISLNTSVSNRRGNDDSVSVDALSFSGLNVDAGALDAARQDLALTGSSGFNETFLFAGVDMSQMDFTISGELSMFVADGSREESPRFQINLRNADAEVVPLPGPGLLGLAGVGLVAARRRRA